MSNVLSESSGVDGFLIQSQAESGAGSMSVSNMDKIFTFGNSGAGFAVIGTAAQPIFGPRLTNSFFGGDGTDEIIYDGFGGDIQISNSFFELVGTGTTGPNNSTPATNSGSGIEIDNGS